MIFSFHSANTGSDVCIPYMIISNTAIPWRRMLNLYFNFIIISCPQNFQLFLSVLYIPFPKTSHHPVFCGVFPLFPLSFSGTILLFLKIKIVKLLLNSSFCLFHSFFSWYDKKDNVEEWNIQIHAPHRMERYDVLRKEVHILWNKTAFLKSHLKSYDLRI